METQLFCSLKDWKIRRNGIESVLLLALAMAMGAPSARASCTVSWNLVNSCGPWLGAWANDYPQTGADFESQILYHEQRLGRQMSIVHSYHPLGTYSLSSEDLYFIDRPNTYLLANWNPANPWIEGAGGNSTVNAQIDEMAASIKRVSPKKIFLALVQEPETDISKNNPGLTCTLNQGKDSGSEADYVNMWHNVRKRFDNAGVNNVIWVIIYQGGSKFDPCMTDALYPGNSYVDWVAWDPYDATGSWWTSVHSFYDTLISLSNSTYNYASKPWMISEFGEDGSAGQSKAYSYYAGAKSALDNNTFHRIHAYVVYDSIGSLYTQTEYGGSSSSNLFLDPTEQVDYNNFANDSKFVKP